LTFETNFTLNVSSYYILFDYGVVRSNSECNLASYKIDDTFFWTFNVIFPTTSTTTPTTTLFTTTTTSLLTTSTTSLLTTSTTSLLTTSTTSILTTPTTTPTTTMTSTPTTITTTTLLTTPTTTLTKTPSTTMTSTPNKTSPITTLRTTSTPTTTTTTTATPTILATTLKIESEQGTAQQKSTNNICSILGGIFGAMEALMLTAFFILVIYKRKKENKELQNGFCEKELDIRNSFEILVTDF
jgi:hypothetical protein